MNNRPNPRRSIWLTLFRQWNRLFPTAGLLAIAAGLIALVTGIVLAIPYDVNRPFESLQVLMLGNRPGAFFRGLHYWSGQLFLVFTVWHTMEHLLLGTEKKLQSGPWLRLTLSVPVILFLMLSGFILTGDGEGLLARRILAALIQTIPQIGTLLEFALLGPEEDFQIIYVHHIASTTIFVLLVIIEHARRIWADSRSMIIIFSLAVLLSIFALPGLYSGLDPVIKGPWYLLGLQEILYWTACPGWVVAGSTALLVCLYLTARLPEKPARFLKRMLAVLFAAYLMLTLIGWLFRGENWRFIWPV